MLRYFSIALALFVLLIAGCGQKMGIKMKKPAKFYMSVISLSPNTSEIAYLNIGADRLKARTASCTWPMGIERKPIVVTGTKPDYEAIAAIKPDIIIYDPLMYSDTDIAKFKELNIETFALKAGSVKEFKDSIAKIGGMMHCETNMWDYIDKIDAAMTKGKRDPGTKLSKVAVIMPGQGGEHYIAGLNTFQADIVRCSGGEPVGPEADRFVPLNAESLIAMNPDVILVAGNASSVENDPRLKPINALKNKRVLPIKQEMMLRAGTRVDVLIENLAKAL